MPDVPGVPSGMPPHPQARYLAEFERFERAIFKNVAHGASISGFSVRFPGSYDGEFLIVFRGRDPDKRAVVAFHSQQGLLEALSSGLRRVRLDQVKWREDEYRK